MSNRERTAAVTGSRCVGPIKKIITRMPRLQEMKIYVRDSILIRIGGAGIVETSLDEEVHIKDLTRRS